MAEGPALKRLSPTAVDAAIARAERYRLLNEPEEAESICLDVLEVEPHSQPALRILLLARSDQIPHGGSRALSLAREVLPRLESEYERAYFHGVVCERHAKALLKRKGRRSGGIAYEWFQSALEAYEQAEALAEPGNDEAVLRWNACLRTIERHPHCARDPEEQEHFGLE